MASLEGGRARRNGPSLAVQAVSHHGLIVLACLLTLASLAWWWLSLGGMPSSGGTMAAMPDMAGMAMAPAPDPWSAAYLGSTFAMWAVMMVAMMLPTAAPMILLHDVFSRKNGFGAAATLTFAASYALLWTLFALLAALAQAGMVWGGLIEQASLQIGENRLIALLLAAAGLYQMSPLKRRCLAQCQSPVSFLMRNWRPGVGGALTMGLRHGLHCIGCCMFLMLLLFVGGVMNLAWIALLTGVVLAEKYLPRVLRADLVLAVVLLAAAAAAALR